MKKAVYVSLLAVLATTPPAVGKAESWCIRDLAGVTSEICAFSSAQDCVRAALVGPSGGIVCAQERGPIAKGGEHQGKRHATPLRAQTAR